MMVGLEIIGRDALGEAGNIGAGFAARAMESLLGEGSTLSPPRVGSGARPIGPIEIGMPLAGPFAGEVLVAFSAPAAGRILERLAGEGERDLMSLGRQDRSCLCEAANMLACAYLTGLENLTDLLFRPLPPIMNLGGWPEEKGLWVASRLRTGAGFEVDLILHMESDGVALMLAALGTAA